MRRSGGGGRETGAPSFASLPQPWWRVPTEIEDRVMDDAAGLRESAVYQFEHWERSGQQGRDGRWSTGASVSTLDPLHSSTDVLASLTEINLAVRRNGHKCWQRRWGGWELVAHLCQTRCGWHVQHECSTLTCALSHRWEEYWVHVPGRRQWERRAGLMWQNISSDTKT